jgi:integrase
LLRTAANPDPAAKASKRWPERDVALIATFSVTGIRLGEAIALNLNSITGRGWRPPAASHRQGQEGPRHSDRADA